MIGIELTQDIANDVKYKAVELGLMTTAVRPAVIRLVPPLIIEESHCDEAIRILTEAINACRKD